MAVSYCSVIRDIFREHTTHNCSPHHYSPADECPTKFMDIPIKGSKFEVPVFALGKFDDLMEDSSELPDAITVVLESDGRGPRYTSLDKVLTDVLTEGFKWSRLVKLDISKLQENYWGTIGALFDKDLNPVLMCSWVIERKDNDFDFLYPIVRIDPKCFINPENILEKFLGKKFPATVLEYSWEIPYNHSVNSLAKVEFYDNPFVIREASVPSYSTTNEELLQAAIDHIDEVVS